MTRPNLRNGAFAALLAAAVLALTFFAPNLTARSEPSVQVTPMSATQANWRVIDGDTFEDLDTGDRYRLQNIDTPESGSRARCGAERQLGDQATRQARAFISNARSLDVRRTGRVDRYDRIIAFIQIDGRDLGEMMIAEGLARPWRGRRGPWCDASGHLIP